MDQAGIRAARQRPLGLVKGATLARLSDRRVPDPMKILYLSSSVEDYLSDALFHGLRCLLGADVVDFPKSELLYNNCPEHVRKQARGNGFTLYTGLLEDIPVDRFNIVAKVQQDYFDLVVISDIWRQFGWFVELRPWLKAEKTIVLDGADTPQTYPYAGLWWRRPYYWFLPRAHTSFPYYKREWTEKTRFDTWSRALPQAIRARLPLAATPRRIAFSIPAEKIVRERPPKTKDFPTHVVDAELAARLGRAQTGYAFNTEQDYYADLQSARFGITTKRAGWDCLRHYEIAANGAVPCFRGLDDKPATCAPHGLTRENCIVYRGADDLLGQIAALSDCAYDRLQQSSMRWVWENSTEGRARQLLAELGLLQALPGATG